MRRHRTFLTIALVGWMGVAGCGGKKGSTAPVEQGGEEDDGDGEASGDGEDLIPPEQMDEIGSLLDRKRPAAARCLSDAVLAGKAPKNARGTVSLTFVIGTDGKARKIEIIKSTIQNETVEQCVVEKVESIDFPQLSKDLEWSYAFGFESM